MSSSASSAKHQDSLNNKSEEPAATPGTAKIAGVGRRFGGLFYDAFLIVALWFVATALMLAALGLLGVEVEKDNPLVGSWLFQIYLLAVAFAYYAWSLCVSGQTLGMRAWRVKAVSQTLGPVTLKICAIRFLTCLGGLAHLSCWFHPSREAFNDLLSQSKLVVIKAKS